MMQIINTFLIYYVLFILYIILNDKFFIHKFQFIEQILQYFIYFKII